MKPKRVAIVYDWMDKMGGVERMLLVLHDLYPDADWYTSFVDYSHANWIPDQVRDDTLRTSFMQRLPSFIKRSRIFSLPFFPFAFESFDFSEYDLVISVTSSFAKGIITKPGTKHICILLTPTRWLWSQSENYELPITNYQFPITNFRFLIPLQSALQKYLKRWDVIASVRPDKIISISKTVAERCKKYYHRDSIVVYPPFEREYWKEQKINGSSDQKTKGTKEPSNKYFLVVSRLEPYKKIDLVIEAFHMMPEKRLIIVGTGSMEKRLKQIAGTNCTFISGIEDTELAQYYRGAQALIMPQEEDFGYVALEAQACGCPVIAYARGGARETVRPQDGNVLFPEQNAECIRKAVADFTRGTYNLGESLTNDTFGVGKFQEALRREIHAMRD